MRRITVASLIVFLSLLGVLWQQSGVKRERGITRISLTDLDRDLITKIDIVGEHPMTLEKRNGTWHLANGRTADGDAIDRMFDAISRIESRDLITRSETRFGELEVDEKGGVGVKLSQGAEVVADFVVGKVASAGSYVLIEDAVYLVARVYAGSFARTASAWANRQLFSFSFGSPAEGDEALAVRLKVQSGMTTSMWPYTIYPKADNPTLWQPSDVSRIPKNFRFDEKTAATVVRTLANLRVKEFLDTAPEGVDTGLGDSADLFTIETKAPHSDQSKTLVLKLGNEHGDEDSPGVYGSVPGIEELFTLSTATAESLRKDLESFRNLDLMDFERDQVERLTIRNGKTKLVLGKEADGWLVTSSSESPAQGFEVDPRMVGEHIWRLKSARALRLASKGRRLGKTTMSVTVHMMGGKQATLNFGNGVEVDGERGILAQGNADGHLYLVPEKLRRTLIVELDAFKKATLLGAAGINPADLAKLPPELRQQLLEQVRAKQREAHLADQKNEE